MDDCVSVGVGELGFEWKEVVMIIANVMDIAKYKRA